MVELPPPLAAQPAGRDLEIRAGVGHSPVDPTDWELPDPAADSPFPWLRLLYAQGTEGEYQPCGCPGAPTGGIPRRKSWIDVERRMTPDVFLVEGPAALGQAPLGPEHVTKDAAARARFVLELLPRIGLDAFFPGGVDLDLVPVAEAFAVTQRGGLDLVVTNLAPSARPAGMKDHLVVERGGRRTLLLGLLARPASAASARGTPRIDAPDAVRDVLARVGGVDAVIAFTDADGRELDRWAEAGLDVDLLLLGPAPRSIGRVRERGGLITIRSQPFGRAFDRLDLVFNGPVGRAWDRGSSDSSQIGQVAAQEGRYHRKLVDLVKLRAAGGDPAAIGLQGDEPPEDVLKRELAASKHNSVEAMQRLRSSSRRHTFNSSWQLVGEFLPEDAALRERIDQWSAEQLGVVKDRLKLAQPEAASGVYGGAANCVDCHGAAQAHWASTAHRRAYSTLQAIGKGRDPDCLACHTTGFGVPGGFADPEVEPRLLGVQCEACHGPMAEHTQQVGKPGARPAPAPKVTKRTCLRCHDPRNSPRFVWAEYISKVIHPGLAIPPEEEEP